MFSRFIEERSFLSSGTMNQTALIHENLHHNYSLAFFDECCKRVQQSIENNEQQSFSLLETSSTRKDFLTEKTTLILPDFVDSNSPSTTHQSAQGLTNGNRIHSQTNADNNHLRLPQDATGSTGIPMKLIPNSPMVKRSKYERDKCQKVRSSLDIDETIEIYLKTKSLVLFRLLEKIKQNQRNGLIAFCLMFIPFGLCIYQQ